MSGNIESAAASKASALNADRGPDPEKTVINGQAGAVVGDIAGLLQARNASASTEALANLSREWIKDAASGHADPRLEHKIVNLLDTLYGPNSASMDSTGITFHTPQGDVLKLDNDGGGSFQSASSGESWAVAHQTRPQQLERVNN